MGIEKFLESFCKDEAFRAELDEYINKNKPESEEKTDELIVAYASSKGYDFTVEQYAFAKSQQREMDEDELRMVSGGSYNSLGPCSTNYSFCKDSYKPGENCWHNDDCNNTYHMYKDYSFCKLTSIEGEWCLSVDDCIAAWNIYTGKSKAEGREQTEK